MDVHTLRTLEIVGYYIGAFVLSNIIARLVISRVIKQLIKRTLKREDSSEARWLAGLIGSVEQAMYTASILLGYPGFIGVWLVLKAAGQWKVRWSGDDAIGVPKEYTIFLIGNALSFIGGVATALLIQQFLPPFPSLTAWQIPTS